MSYARSVIQAAVVVAVSAAALPARAQEVALYPANLVDFGDVPVGKTARQLVVITSDGTSRSVSASVAAPYRVDVARQAGDVVLDVRFSPTEAMATPVDGVVIVQVSGLADLRLPVRGRGVDASNAPRILSVPMATAVVGREYAYATHVEQAPGGGGLTYALTRGPGSLDRNGTLRWVPGPGDAGVHEVNLTATDAHGSATQRFWIVAIRVDVNVAVTTPFPAVAQHDIALTVTVTPPRLLTVAGGRAASNRLRVEQALAPGVTLVSADTAPTSSAGSTLVWELPTTTTAVTTLNHRVQLDGPTDQRALTSGCSARLGLGAPADSLEIHANLLRALPSPDPEGIAASGDGLVVVDAASKVSAVDRTTGAHVEQSSNVGAGPQDLDVTDAAPYAVLLGSGSPGRPLAEFLAGGTRTTRTDGFHADTTTDPLAGFAIDPTTNDRYFASAGRLYRFDRHFGDHRAAPTAGVQDVAGDAGGLWMVSVDGAGAGHLHFVPNDPAQPVRSDPLGLVNTVGIAVDGDRLLVLQNGDTQRRLYRVTKASPPVVEDYTSLNGFGGSGAATLTGLDKDPLTGDLLISSNHSTPTAIRLSGEFGRHLRTIGAKPTGVTYAATNDIWVSDENQTIYRLDGAGGSTAAWPARWLDNVALVKPSAVALDGDDVLVLDESASDGARRFLYAFGPDGTPRRRTLVQPLSPLLSSTPQGVHRDPSTGDLLLTFDSSTTDELVRVDRRFGAHHPAPSAGPQGAVVGNGGMWTVDASRFRLSALDRDGTVSRSFPTTGGSAGRAIAYDAARDQVMILNRTDVLYSTLTAHRASDGAEVNRTLLPRRAYGTSQDFQPQGFAWDATTQQYALVDSQSKKLFRIGKRLGDHDPAPGLTDVRAFTQSGDIRWYGEYTAKRITRIQNGVTTVTPITFGTSNQRPVGMAVDGDGSLLVLLNNGAGDVGATVVRYHRDTTAQLGTVTYPSALPENGILKGVRGARAQGIAVIDRYWHILEDNSGSTPDRLVKFDSTLSASTAYQTHVNLVLPTNVTGDRIDACTAADGVSVVVLDGVTQRLNVTSLADGKVTAFTRTDWYGAHGAGETGTFPGPQGVVWDQAAGVYRVYDNGLNNRVFAIDAPSGTPFVTEMSLGTINPRGVTVGPGGQLRVIDAANTVHEVVGSTITANKIDARLYGCTRATDIASDGVDLYAVADAATGIVQEARIYPMAATGSPVKDRDAIANPRGVCTAAGSKVFVATTNPGRVLELDSTGSLVRSFNTADYGCGNPTDITWDGVNLRVSETPTDAAEPGRIFVMAPTGLRRLDVDLTPHQIASPRDVTAGRDGTMLVVDGDGSTIELDAGGRAVGPPQDLRQLGVTAALGAGHELDADGNVGHLHFAADDRIYRTSPAGVVLRTADLALDGVSGVNGLAFDGESGHLFLSSGDRVWESCVDADDAVPGNLDVKAWTLADRAAFTWQGAELGSFSDLAVNRAAGEVYVTSAVTDMIYVFSLGEHRAPNPARVLVVAEGDAGAFVASLRAKGHDVEAAAVGSVDTTLDDTFTQVWVVGAQAGPGLDASDLAALDAWRTSSQRRHVVLDALVGRDQGPCDGIKYAQDLAGALELHGGGVLLVAGPEAAGGEVANEVLAALGFAPARFAGSHVTPSSSLVGRGDLVTLTWLSSWFQGDLTHANLPEGSFPAGELHASLEGTATAPAGRVVLLSSTIRAAAGVPDVASPGVNEPAFVSPPTIAFTAPAAGALVSSNSVSVALSYSDDVGVDPSTLVVTANGVDVSAAFTKDAASAAGTVSFGADGLVELVATIKDLRGNESLPAVVRFTVDTTAPVIEVRSNGALVGADVLVVEQTSPEGAAVPLEFTVLDANPGEPPYTTSGTLAVYPPGESQVVITATDAALHQSTRTVTIRVQDTTAPFLALQDPQQARMVVEQAAAAGTQVTLPLVDASDACDPSVDVVYTRRGTAEVVTSPVTLQLGAHALTVTATDDAGNASQLSVDITIVDTTPPAISSPAGVVAEATSAAGAVVTFELPSATDVCDASPAVTCSHVPGSTFPLGVTTVTCTATDASGNSAATSFTITVRDTTGPTLAQADMVVEQTNAAGTPVTFAPAATDAVDPAPVVVCTPTSGSTFALGTWPVTCTATDAAGNQTTLTFSVTVSDTTRPTLATAPDLTAEATSAAGAVVTFGSPSATDICDASPVVACTPASGSTFALGTTTVTCTATDASGNAGTTTFTVTVVDSTPPILTVSGDLTAEQASAAGTSVTFAAASAVDAVDPAPRVESSHAPGASFPLGTTTVTCTATDAAGNTVSKSFTVTVVDTTAPSLAAASDVIAEATSAAGAVVTFTAPAATDVCDAAPVVACSPLSGSTFALGTTTVTCTATDASGNASTTTFTVTVQDTTAPTFDGPAVDVSAEQTSLAGAAVTFALPSASDGVSAVTVSSEPASGTTFQLGSTTVVVTAKDAAGNTATTALTVQVVDTTAPAMTAPADVTAEATSAAGAVVTYTAPTSTDLCDADVVVTCTPASGSTFALGQTTVTCVADDDSGNRTTVTFVVNVVDRTGPTLERPADIAVEQAHLGGTNVTFATPAATDAVDPSPTVTCDPASGSVFPLGPTRVTCTATDDAGNTSTVTFTVTVSDTLAPSITASPVVVEQTDHAGAQAAFAPTATDACDAACDVTCDPPAGTTFPLGKTTVTATAVDNTGHTATTTFEVLVQDTTPPTVSVPAELTVQSTGGPVSASDPQVADWLARVAASDICDSLPWLSSNAPAEFSVGRTQVVFTARDASGNESQGTGWVNVLPATGDTTVEITSPTDGACLADESVSLTYVVTPTGTAVSVSGTRTLAGVTTNVGAGPYTEEGDYVVTAAAGTASDMVSFSIDRTDPTVEITSPVSNPHAGAYPSSQYRTTIGDCAVCCEHPGAGGGCKHHDKKGKGHSNHGGAATAGGDAPGNSDGHRQDGKYDGATTTSACEHECCLSRVPSDLPIELAYEAKDDDGIAGDVALVELFLDGLSLPSSTTGLDAAAFVRLGLPVLGRHTLLVRVTDLAGNVGVADVCFEIVLHADRCAAVLQLARETISAKGKDEDKKGKDKTGKDKDSKDQVEKVITVRMDLPATLTGSPLDPAEADVIGSTLRLRGESGRTATALSTTVSDGVLVARFRESDLGGSDALGKLFTLTGRFFSTSGAAFVAEGELNKK